MARRTRTRPTDEDSAYTFGGRVPVPHLRSGDVLSSVHRGLLRRRGPHGGRPAVAGVRVPVPEPGHRPVLHVEDAEPGDTLAVHFLSDRPGPRLGGVQHVPALRGADLAPPTRPRCSRRWRNGSGCYDIDIDGRHGALPGPQQRLHRGPAAGSDARHGRRRTGGVRGPDDDRRRTRHGGNMDTPELRAGTTAVPRGQRARRDARPRRRARPAGPRRGRAGSRSRSP